MSGATYRIEDLATRFDDGVAALEQIAATFVDLGSLFRAVDALTERIEFVEAIVTPGHSVKVTE